MSHQELQTRKAQALRDAYEADLRDGTVEPFTGQKKGMIQVSVFSTRTHFFSNPNPVHQEFREASRIHKGWR